MNYRKFYSLKTNRELPIDFDVHHIDFFRTNNDIFNLVALPKKLHKQLHFLMPPESEGIPRKLCGGFPYSLEQLQNYITVYIECCKWVDYRNYLLGIVPMMTSKSYDNV